MKRLLRRPTPGIGLLLAAALLAGAVTAAEPDVDLPTTRAERAQLLFRQHQVAARGPAAPGGASWDGWDQPAPAAAPRVDLGRFTQFLQNSLEQARGKTYQDSAAILRDSTQRARQVAPLPPGLDTALGGVLAASAACDSYEARYKVFVDGLGFVIHHADALVAEPRGAFPALLDLARSLGYGLSYQNSYEARKRVLLALRERRDLAPSPTHEVLVSALLTSADATASYEARGKVYKQVLTGFLQGPQDPPVRAYLAALGAAGEGISYQDAYASRNALLAALRDHPELVPGPLFQTTVAGALGAVAKVDSYEGRAKVLGKVGEFLNRVGPRDGWKAYYRLVLDAGGGLSYQNSYLVRTVLAQTLLESGQVDAFDRVAIETAVDSASRASSYEARTKLLHQAFQQLL